MHWKDRKLERACKTLITFKVPKKPLEFWIPKSSDDWNEFMAARVKQRCGIQALTERELKKVIRKSIYFISSESNPQPKECEGILPPCYFWGQDEVGAWLKEIGWEFLVVGVCCSVLRGNPQTSTFEANQIDGRKLIRVTEKFLLAIGLTDVREIQGIYKSIRSNLGLPTQRQDVSQSATSLNYKISFKHVMKEKYLWKKSFTGKKIDALSFKDFCASEGVDSAEI